eukprot:gene2908-29369_t
MRLRLLLVSALAAAAEPQQCFEDVGSGGCRDAQGINWPSFPIIFPRVSLITCQQLCIAYALSPGNLCHGIEYPWENDWKGGPIDTLGITAPATTHVFKALLGFRGRGQGRNEQQPQSHVVEAQLITLCPLHTSLIQEFFVGIL